MEQEEWKDIKGFEGLYQISSFGNIKALSKQVNYNRFVALRKERVIKAGKDKQGYRRVILAKDGIKFCYRVCRLVAQNFIPNPKNYPCVNHKDEVKDNDKANNLEWCSIKYNNTYGKRLKNVSKKLQRKIIRESTGEIYDSETLAAQSLGVSLQTVSNALRGVTKNKLGLKYIEDEKYGKK